MSPPDTPGIEGFVRAARLLRDGSGSPDIRAATDAVGRAAEQIGLDRFKPFLQAADDHLQSTGGLLTLARFPPSPLPPTLAGRVPGLLVRTPWGAVVGLAAQVLPMVAELIRREDVRATIKRFGLDPSKPADVTAAYAFLWAEDHGPWLFDTPQTGPEMQAMAERVMRAARADPALFGRAIAGDEEAQEEFSAAVAPPAPDSGIVTHNDEERALVEQRVSEGRTAAEIQAELNTKRASGSGRTAEDRRTSPGRATMNTKLSRVTGRWLTVEASANGGVAIPGQVADKLVGQQFADFGQLREAIWKLVAQTPELAAPFNEQNLARMRDGKAPFPPRSEQVVIRGSGQLSQRTWELHHDPAIGRGGDVYNLNTIRIVTPKQHDAIGKAEQ